MKLTQCFLQAASSAEESDESATSPQQTLRKTPVTKPAATTRRPSDAAHKKTTRSASSESTTSTESSAGSSSGPRTTGAAYTTEEVKQKYLSRGSIDSTPDTPRSRIPSTGAKDATPTKPFQSRFLNKSTPTPPPPKEEETETSTEEETETEEESDDNATGGDHKDMSKTDIGPLLARSAQARDNGSDPKRKDDSSSFTRSRYGSQREESPLSKYSRSRTTGAVQDEEPPSKYGYTSRFLNKSKSSAAVPPEEEEHSRYGGDDSESKYPSGRSRYMALKERRQRLARSRSSHTFPDDDDVDEPISPTSSNPSAYLASKGYGSATSSGNDLARSRSTHALKSRENSPDRSAGTEKDGAALSSWARYLKSKYGNRSGAKDKDSSSNSLTPSSSNSTATARRLSLGLPLRSSADLGSSDDDQKNMQGSPTTPTAATAAAGKFP